MATLEAPFTAKQLKSAIGASGNNVNNYFTGSDGYINPYSTFKPVRSNSDESDEYLMQDCNFGFNTSYISSTDIITIFDNAKSYGTWEDLYQHPTSSYLYRWEDFNGYDSEAEPPFNYDEVQTSITSDTIEQVITRNSNTIDVTKMGIVTDYSDWYWAIAHRKSDTTSVSYSYGGEVSSWDDEIVITQKFEESGTYECVLIMTNSSRHIWMDGGYFTVNVAIDTRPKLLAGLDYARWYNTSSIQFRVFIENQGSTNATVTSPVVIKLRFAEKNWDDDMVVGEYQYNWDVSTIKPGASNQQWFEKTQMGLSNYNNRIYKICMRVYPVNGDAIIVEEEFERELS
jgi:hypothetical protein